MNFKTFISKIYFRIAPSKIFIAISKKKKKKERKKVRKHKRKTATTTKNYFKRKNTNPTFKQTKNFLITLLELLSIWKDFSYQVFKKLMNHYNKSAIGLWKVFLCLINCSVNYKPFTPRKVF